MLSTSGDHEVNINAEEVANKVKDAAKIIRKTSSTARDTVRKFHKSGVVSEYAGAVQEAAVAAQDTAIEIRDTAMELRDSHNCRSNGTSSTRYSQPDSQGST